MTSNVNTAKSDALTSLQTQYGVCTKSFEAEARLYTICKFSPYLKGNTVSITMISCLQLLKEIVDVYSKKHTKPINYTVSKMQSYLLLTRGCIGTCSYHWMLKCERNVQYDYSARIFSCSYQGDGNDVPLPCPSFIFVGLAFSRWRSKLFAQQTEIT
jgi:hypothetical protein